MINYGVVLSLFFTPQEIEKYGVYMDIDVQLRVESLSPELEQGAHDCPISSRRENNPYEMQEVMSF